jgi:hypothetical protein
MLLGLRNEAEHRRKRPRITKSPGKMPQEFASRLGNQPVRLLGKDTSPPRGRDGWGFAGGRLFLRDGHGAPSFNKAKSFLFGRCRAGSQDPRPYADGT